MKKTKILALVMLFTVVISSIFLLGFRPVRISNDELISVSRDDVREMTHDAVTPTVPKVEQCSISEPIERIESFNEYEVPNYYEISNEERDLLARLCFLEASICSEECQRAVVSVIFNRLESGKWKEDMNNDGKITLFDIIYYPNAFSPAPIIHKYEADAEAFAAVDYVIQNGPTIPEYVRYFRINYDFTWDNYSNYDVMDTVYFGYLDNWEEGAW